MDRKNIVEELQRAFSDNTHNQESKDAADVEFLESTKSLRVNKQSTYESPSSKNMQEVHRMSEEEVFGRLLKERRSKQAE